MARLSSDLVLSLTDRVSGPARVVNRNLDALQRQTGMLGRSARMTYDDVGLLTRAGPMMVGSAASVLAPIGAALGAQQVVTAAADFETALTNIQKKAGTTTAETAALGEEIKALATSGELAVPIDEIAAAYERGAAAGIPVGELKEFARVSAMASDAFEMSAADVGNAAAGFSKILKIPMNEMERYFDLVNTLADSGIADESDLVAFADAAGAPLKDFGLANEQIAALGATMANLKVPTDVAANAMKSFTSRLAAPAQMDKRGQKWLARLTGGIPEFQKAIEEDANGAIMKLLESVNELDRFDKMEAIAAIAGGNYGDNVATLAANLDEWRRNLALAADDASWLGSLSTTYRLKLDDFWSQWQLVKNALQELAINNGEAGMPVLKQGLEVALGLVQEVDAGLKTFRAEVDTDALAQAAGAVGALGEQIGIMLGATEGEGQHIQRFFRDLAGAVNDVSAAVTGVSRAFEDVTAFANDPFGYMKTRAEMPDRELKDRYGITRLSADEVNDRVERQDRRRNDEHARGRAQRREDLASTDGAAAAWTRQQMFLRGELAPGDYRPQDPERAFGTAERLGFNRHREGVTNGLASSYFRRQTGANERQLDAETANMPESARAGMQAYADAIAAAGGRVTEEARAIAAKVRAELAAIAPPAPASPIGAVDRAPLPPASPAPALRAPGELPIPTPRPNIAAPYRQETEQAAAAAEAAGQRIGDALNVTARPTIDTGSIRQAASEAQALARILERIPGLASRASAASASARADYSGIHADIER